MVAGAGLVSLLIAALAAGERSAPWLLIGLGLVAAGVVAYAVARRLPE